MADHRNIVIIGAGIIGCATAYYLSHSEGASANTIHLVESAPELFASASGKAGGFLASDWFGHETESLGELSFRLHRELAEQQNGNRNWGYSRSTGTSYQEGSQSDVTHNRDWLRTGGSRAQATTTHEYHSDRVGPVWLRQRVGDQVDTIGDKGSVAQVDPLRLSKFLLQSSLDKGGQLHHVAEAVRVSFNETGQLNAVHIEQREGESLKIPCTHLLITSGAWTPLVFSTLFPTSKLRIPISQLAGYSLVVRSPRWTKSHETEGCHGIFTSMRGGISPEIFSRVGEEIYVAGLNDPHQRLPPFPTDAKIDSNKIDKLKTIAERLLGDDLTDVSDIQILREGLCFRPVTRKGTPILCRIPDRDLGQDIHTRPGAAGGVYIAAGHGPWGISHSLGTGKVMAEMLEGQPSSADVQWLGLY